MPAPVSRDAATALSVVIVTYNSGGVVAAALRALYPQLAPGDELVIVDNASSDDTLRVVSSVAPGAVIVRNLGNVGFAAAANAGARAARGDLLLFLNPDASPAPGFVDAIRAPRDRWTAWMGLVKAGDQINTSGGVMHFTGIAWAGHDPVIAPREVAFLSGACLAIPRLEWERVGGFSATYFMYQEDVDLSLRLRLAGARLGIEPAAVVDHDYEFAKGPHKWRLLERNRWATIVRCYPAPLLMLVAPALLATEAVLLAVALAGGWLPEKLAATGDTARALPRLLQERRAVQATRALPIASLAAWMTPDLASPFLGRVGRLAPLRSALRLYWRAVLSALRWLAR
jgi:GT2 family glycosyltransferase